MTMLPIIPNKGLGSVRFGMTPEESEQILGTRENSSSYDDIFEIYLPNELNLSFRGERLFQIGATRRAQGVTYRDIDVFAGNPMEILRVMEEDSREGTVFECLGFIIFLSLGVTLTGFHDKDVDNKALTVFAPGTWDQVKDDLRPANFFRDQSAQAGARV